MAESAKRMWSPDEFDDSSAKKICLAEDVKHDVDAPIEIGLAATPEVSTVEVSTAEISAVEDFSVEDSAVEDSAVEDSTMEVQTPDVSIVEVSTAEVSAVEDSTVEVSTIDLSTEESNMNLTVESIDLTKPLELPTRPPRRKASMVDKTQKVVKKVRMVPKTHSFLLWKLIFISTGHQSSCSIRTRLKRATRPRLRRFLDRSWQGSDARKSSLKRSPLRKRRRKSSL